jgi:hypothetical protein
MVKGDLRSLPKSCRYTLQSRASMRLVGVLALTVLVLASTSVAGCGGARPDPQYGATFVGSFEGSLTGEASIIFDLSDDGNSVYAVGFDFEDWTFRGAQSGVQLEQTLTASFFVLSVEHYATVSADGSFDYRFPNAASDGILSSSMRVAEIRGVFTSSTEAIGSLVLTYTGAGGPYPLTLSWVAAVEDASSTTSTQ